MLGIDLAPEEQLFLERIQTEIIGGEEEIDELETYLSHKQIEIVSADDYKWLWVPDIEARQQGKGARAGHRDFKIEDKGEGLDKPIDHSGEVHHLLIAGE